MAVRKGEHVLILTDRDTRGIADAIMNAAEKVSEEKVMLFVLEDYAQRPVRELPKQILEALPKADVTFYAAQSMPGELAIRGPFIRAATKHARHGHMPGITQELMETGMCADYQKISELTKKVNYAVQGCSTAKVMNRSGTELEVRFHPAWRWKISDGLYWEKGMWGNLPDGEIYTAAHRANGTMVIDELGDWFSPKYGVLRETPLKLRVNDSRIDFSSVRCSNSELRTEFLEYIRKYPNGDRLGEFAIGTNIFLDRLTGNLLQDEKFPSVHCAFGDPYSEETGADWRCESHVDGIMLGCSIWVEGKQIMDEGRHLID